MRCSLFATTASCPSWPQATPLSLAAFKPRSLLVHSCLPFELKTRSRSRLNCVGGERFRAVELAVLLALGVELAQVVALAVEDLHAVIEAIGDGHLTLRAQHCDADGRRPRGFPTEPPSEKLGLACSLDPSQ